MATHVLDSIDVTDVTLTKVFVVGFQRTTNENELFAFFSQFGAVKDVEVKKDRNGVSKCFGFVTFEDAEGSMKCLEETDKSFGGRVLHCRLASTDTGEKNTSKRSHNEVSENIMSPEEDMALRKIFVRDLPKSVTDESFRSFFQQFGDMSNAHVSKDRNTGHVRGFGFVTYSSRISAMRCLEQSHKVIGGAIVATNLAEKDPQLFGGLVGTEEDLRKLFIRGLSDQATDQGLNELLKEFGEIEQCCCIKKGEKNAGYGFCTFKLASDAMKALENPNKMLDGRRVVLQLAVRGRKKKQRNNFNQQYNQNQPNIVYQPVLYHQQQQQQPQPMPKYIISPNQNALLNIQQNLRKYK